MCADTGQLRTILFVEDVTETRRGMERLLKTSGYRVIPVADAESAVSAMRERTPDVILIDLGMPPRDVLAAGRDIRERAMLDNVPVVVIASGFDVERLDEPAGGGDFITHLDDFEQLENLLERILTTGKPATGEREIPSRAVPSALRAVSD